jgi:hypothetical protein
VDEAGGESKRPIGQALRRGLESLPLPVLPGNRDMVRVHTDHITIQETRTERRAEAERAWINRDPRWRPHGAPRERGEGLD